MTARIHHLFTSPGHNYFGHHEKPPGTHEIVAHQTIQLVAGRGIPGDRFFDWKDHYKGQITFLDQQVVDDIRAHAENPDLAASAFRRNVVIEGLDLNTLIGVAFRLNGILLEGTEECRPCYWMDQACGKPGTEDLMKGRGGLRCRILEDGELGLGEVELSLQTDTP
ncbi:MAG: MOSC domain-containing protein [Verrucomicrobiota bacterium]